MSLFAQHHLLSLFYEKADLVGLAAILSPNTLLMSSIPTSTRFLPSIYDTCVLSGDFFNVYMSSFLPPLNFSLRMLRHFYSSPNVCQGRIYAVLEYSECFSFLGILVSNIYSTRTSVMFMLGFTFLFLN